MIQIIKHVFNKRALELITSGGLEIVHTVDELLDNLLVALSNFAAISWLPGHFHRKKRKKKKITSFMCSFCQSF